MDLPRLCLARRQSFPELFGDALECQGKGVGDNSRGACTLRSFLDHAHTKSRRTHSQRRIAFVLPPLLTEGRERLCLFSSASHLIPLPIRSAINKIPTLCIPLNQSLSVCSRTHRQRTLPSLPIAILSAWLLPIFQRFYQCTGRTNSTFQSRLSVPCFRSTLQHRSSSFRFSVLRCGCSTSTGTIVSLHFSCLLFLSAPSCGRCVILWL